MALALKRQSNITLVGQTTRGLATVNELLALPDQLGNYMLTVANDLDENDEILLMERIEPQVKFDPLVNQVEEAKKLFRMGSRALTPFSS